MPAVKHQEVLLRLLAAMPARTARWVDGHDRTGLFAAEVGVASGLTSARLLAEEPRLHLWMVDHWLVPIDGTRKTQAQLDDAHQTALDRTQFASGRRCVLPLASLAAVVWVEEGGLDLAFIDADHRYSAVAADLPAWWPKVRPGGVLCGHDYDSPKNAAGHWGVRRAVEEWCGAAGLEHAVEESVWIVYKPL